MIAFAIMVCLLVGVLLVIYRLQDKPNPILHKLSVIFSVVAVALLLGHSLINCQVT